MHGLEALRFTTGAPPATIENVFYGHEPDRNCHDAEHGDADRSPRAVGSSGGQNCDDR